MTTGTATAVLAALAVSLVGSNHQYSLINRHIVFSCAGTAPEVCLHPAFESGTAAITREFAAVQSRLAPTPFALRRVEQRPRGMGSAPSPGAVPFGLDAFRQQDIAEAAIEVVGYEFGARSCGPRLTTESPWLAMIVQAWANGQGGFQPLDGTERTAASGFDALSEQQKQHWITLQADALRTCTLTARDFS